MIEALQRPRTAQYPDARRHLRPSVSLADAWAAPLHDFPLRDEMLYQYLPFSPAMRVLEIGPGAGFTAFCLARHVQSITLVEVAEQSAIELGRQLGHLANVRVVCADITNDGAVDGLRGGFDAAFALDVFEYLVDPQQALRNLASALRPGGELLLSWPNVPPPAGDGVTWFETRAALEALLTAAGFERFDIFTIRLRPWAAALFRALHETPLSAYRQLRRGRPGDRPQTYERTWAFQHRGQWRAFQSPLHMYWIALGQLMRCGGRLFAADPRPAQVLSRQVVVHAWRGMNGERI